jgi:hypothetical protein
MNLAQLMQAATDLGMDKVRDGLYPYPLAMAAGQFDGNYEVFLLDAPTKQLARMGLAATLAGQRSHCCVLVMEAKVARLEKGNPRHDQIRRRVQRGMLSISDLPKNVLEEQLLLIGEDIEGGLADRSWRIIREPDGVRLEIVNDNAVHMSTPWRPMFMQTVLAQLERTPPPEHSGMGDTRN